ncbi:MAG: bifunctional 4-hydroxy-2-oxoglutarate aldolase/2-dehydro-3-deoxy-phosphogluconate aldolase [Candidatus Omnitrophica bacterium]|nr:bifunctional 4-hydroxy-2-oxoglutarate aldolase/2-dehydro-3-deoxy-phosphogluconate aldolase [Candidatus Omnitrophota bacterium]MCM8790336.1 bifunctional 4-hydroxy-2-oxoglutarate aldolase/2-dehydro-3-deoxy-phosphogluconate aldolase [Candidatus Omnitrophota bacterium]
MDLKRFKKMPIMGILRVEGPLPVEEIVETVIGSGLEAIEIAMNSYHAASLIRRAVKASGGKLMIGAGTVLSRRVLEEALRAGATFIVMPVLVRDIVKTCVGRKIPVFPGAFSPGEVYEAWAEGATMVKVFPAGMLGPSYIKELKAPFQDIEILACGGISAENIKAYFSNGASAVAFGASIFRKEWLENKDFDNIRRSIKNLIANAK